jgi:hypothetical protein
VTDEQARRLSESLFAACVQIGVGEAIDTSDVAADLLDARAELAEIHNTYVSIVTGPCAPDEVHCTCVPALRGEIDRLNAELTAANIYKAEYLAADEAMGDGPSTKNTLTGNIRALKARPVGVDAWDSRIKWADACADAGNFWTYSDGWLTVWDSDANHVMLARLEGERVGGRWLSALAPKPASEAVCPTCDGANRVPSITRPDRFAACPDPFHAPPVCGTCGHESDFCHCEYHNPRGAEEGRE